MQSYEIHVTPSSSKSIFSNYGAGFVGHEETVSQLRSEHKNIRHSCKGMRICAVSGDLVQCWNQSRLSTSQVLLEEISPRLNELFWPTEETSYELYLDLYMRMLVCAVCSVKDPRLYRKQISEDWDSCGVQNRMTFFAAVRLAYNTRCINNNKVQSSDNSLADGDSHQENMTVAEEALARTSPSTPLTDVPPSYLTPHARVNRPFKRPVSAGATPSKVFFQPLQSTTQISETDSKSSRGPGAIQYVFEGAIHNKPRRLSSNLKFEFSTGSRFTSTTPTNTRPQVIRTRDGTHIHEKSSSTSISGSEVEPNLEINDSHSVHSVGTLEHLHSEDSTDNNEALDYAFAKLTTEVEVEARKDCPSIQERCVESPVETENANTDVKSVNGKIEMVEAITSAIGSTAIQSTSHPIENECEVQPSNESPTTEAPDLLLSSESEPSMDSTTSCIETVPSRERTPILETDPRDVDPFLENAQRSLSSPAVLQLKGSSRFQIPRDIDNNLRNELLQLTAREGYVYVLQAPEYFKEKGLVPLVKIGVAVNVPSRINHLIRVCRISELEQVPDDQAFAHPFYKKTEKLTHVELANFQRDLKCAGCKSIHKEWFDVAPEVALQVVQRWRKFLENVPYTTSGVLKSPWTDLLERSEMPFLPKEELIVDHDSRNERWEKWVDKGIAMSKEPARAK